MPCNYRIDADRQTLFIRAWGRLVDDEIFATIAEFDADPRLQPWFHRIDDLRDVTEFALGKHLVESLAEHYRTHSTHQRVFVVGSDIAFGLARQLQQLADAVPDVFLVTRDIAHAFEWLGLDPAGGWPD